MAKDFRHGAGSHSKRQFQRKSQQQPMAESAKNASFSKVWAVAFFISALLLAGFVFLQQPSGKQDSESSSNEPSVLTKAQEIKEKAIESVTEVKAKLEPKKVVVEALEVDEEEKLVDSEAKPQFSFYEGLAKTEVVVDAVPLSIQLERPYYIQAGTFGSEKVAQQEQARLARLGQEVELSVYQGSQQIYYRLRVGPYTDRLALNKKRNELRRIGVDTLLVKAPKPIE